MIRLPEGYAIHKRDSACLLGGSWSIRVMYYDANMVTREAFIMRKKIDTTNNAWDTGLTYKEVTYSASLGDGKWIEFNNEEDMCIAMCAKHRMLIR